MESTKYLGDETLKAVQFLGSVPRWIYSKAMGSITPTAYYNGLSNVVLRDVDPPALPSQEWVRVKTKLAGICGSDKNLILLHDSPSTSPYSSFPFTIGHENCGTVTEMGTIAAEKLKGKIDVNQNVLVDPLLSCVPRQVEQVCENCANGDYSLCTNFTEGIISPGLSIGTCRDTGGGWSAEFVAHYSQLLKVPEGVSLEDVVLVDAFCSALHPVMRNFPSDDETVLVIGCGVIGVCVVAALRALGSRAKIVTLVKYPFQGEMASAYGADEVVYITEGTEYYKKLAEALDARLLKPMMGKPVVSGGADTVFECVGNATSIDDALRFSKPKGTMVLVGLASLANGIDLTPIWLSEVNVKGSFWCSSEVYNGVKMTTYQVALELLKSGKLSLNKLLTHKFKIEDYKKAIETNLSVGSNKLIKSAFYFE